MEDFFNENGETIFVSTIHKAKGKEFDIPSSADDIMVSAFVSKGITCEGLADAEVTVTASNGTAPYQYSKTGADNTWNGNALLSGFAPGMQKVYVRDAKGKTAYTLVDVKAPVALRIATYVQAPSAPAAVDGIVTVNVVQGVAPFTYSKFSNSGWQPSAILAGFGAGPYTVYAKDANNCPAVSATGHITYEAPDGINAGASVWQHVTCYAGSDGIINLTATGGTETDSYAFTINGGAATNFDNANSHTITGLAPGTYITKGSESIPAPLTVVINAPAQLTLTATATGATCYGEENAVIVATATGGAGLFKEYSINGAEWTTAGTFTNLGAGLRTVYARDAYGCVATANVTVNQPSAPLTFTVQVVQYSNTDAANDGIVEVDNVAGGVAPYLFSNSDTWTSERRFTGLAHGHHVIYAKDANGCIASYNIYVPNKTTDNSDFDVDAYVSKPLTCATGADAEITFVSSASDIGYSVDRQTYVTTEVLTGFAAGQHTLYARSPNTPAGKVVTVKVEVLPVTPLAIESVAVIPAITETTPLASVNITAKGGTAPLQYRLDTTTDTPNPIITGVVAGSYTVTVTDANGCEATAPLLVNDKPVTGAGSRVSITANVTQALKCAGANNAQITITATGASGAYMYSIDNGTTWNAGSGVRVFTGLPAGTYEIMVRDAADAANQSGVLTLVIAEPALWSITAAATTNVVCTGEATGQITVTSATPGLQYAKNRQDWSANNVLTGFAAGTYIVFAKDDLGCVREASAVVTQNTNPLTITNAAVTKAITLANGAEITLTVAGGTPAYTYALAGNAAASNKLQNVAAGTHQVTVTDANGCIASVTVPVSASGDGITTLSAQATALPKCYADATGEITVTIKGGQAPYVYTNGIDEVTLSALTHVFTALQGGSYPITVTDANGYTLTQEVSVDAPEPLTLSAWGSDGGIVVAEAKGGTPVYSYYLNNTPPISSNVFSGLAVGTYVVNVTDANGCVAQTQTPIEVIDKNKPNENNFSIKAEVTNSVSCTGADGEVTITVMDGTGTFMYAKGDGAYQPSNVFAGLTAGEHVFAAKNATTDLTKRVTVTLPDNGPLTLSVAKIVPVSAATATDGKVTLQAGGGKRPYQYKNAANTEWQNAFVFDGLAATTYTMLVKDATGCEATISVSLAGEGGLMPSIKTQGNVTCYGGNNGWAEIYVTGGSGNYSYSLDNYTWQPSRRLTGLRAGTHTLYVRDNTTLGTSKVTVAITQPAAPLVLTAAPVAPVNPVGSNTAAVKLTAQGGTPAYHYAGTAKVWDIKEVMTGFAPGYHTLFVQDANKCVDSAMVNIGDGATAISLSAVVSKPLTCLGSADAEITLTAGNGTGSYLYAKDGSHWATANVMTGFAAGTYTLHAKDATTGATIATYVEVVMPEQLSATAVVSKPVSGEGQADGEVKFMPAGGTAPYQYRTETGSWQSEDVIVGLPVGTHTFYVKDANNCAETMVRVVMGVDTGASSGTKVSLTATVSGKVTCNNAATGAIAAIARDGDGTFEFSLNGGAWVSATANTYTFTALAAGTYNVAVRSGGQTATVNQLVIAGIAPLSATVAVTDVLCYGQSDGKAVITATGGTAPYQYARTGYAMNGSNEITGLGAGTHLLFVKDAMGCETTVTAAVKPVNKLTLTATVARVITYAGGDNAVVEAKATGGTPGAIGYHYSKTGAAWIYNSNLVPNYGPGQAKVYVRDANNCVAEAAVFIGDYSSSASNTISVTAIVSRPLSCYDNSDAAITLTATGGTPDYTYSKDGVNYAAGAVLTGFPAGEHTVYVKDTKGKVAGVTVTVAPLLPITAYAVVSDNGQNKMATVIAEGGSNSYNYAITPNVSRTGNVFAPMAAGAYTIIVSDANSGCEAAPIYLNVGAGANDVSLSASVTNPLGCLDGNNAEITAVVSGGVAPYRFSRNNGTFQTGSNIFVYANLGAGTYAIVAKDAVGTLSNTVNVPVTSIAAAPLAITAVTARTNTCYGTDNGAITITANGGVPVLQYSISGVDYQLNNTFNRQQLQQGHHHVYVKDALGCVQQSEVTIDTVPEQLQLLIMSTTPPATGSNNGVIVAEAAGGTPVYVYTNGATTQEDDGTFAGLTANTYTLKVTDTQHCEDVSTVILGDGDGTLSIRSVDKQHPKCAGDNSGMITVNVFGGTAPYYYSLADTNYVESVNVFTGLTAGTYTVYVRDAQATPAKTTVVVTLEAASQLAVKAAVVGQKGNNVDVQVVATGGQVPYSYEMGGYFNTTDGLFTDMLSGSYTVYARDANNCEATTTVWAGDDHAGLPSITLEVIKGLLCAGTKTAEVKVTVTGGTAPYQYSADNVVWQTTDIITGLGAGKQTIYVKEANGKVTAAAVVITAPEALKLTVADITATTTADTADGAVTLLATGGRPDYLYSVDDKRYVSDARLDGLRSASYTATVKDANGCKASVPVTVSSADGGNSAVPVDMWAEVTGDITCAGDSNAVVTVHVRNIVDVDYSKDTTIAWTPDNILTGFGAGEAAVYVRDNATGNIGTLTISVKAPVAIQAAAFVSANLSEATAADGAFTVYAVGGTGQYTYAINGGAFHDNPVFSGLAAGTYIFDVKDGNGCQTTVQAVMTMVDVIVSATAIEVGEGEDPVAYTVRLSHQPTANVGLLNSIDSAGMLTITPNSMEYTTSGWNSQKLVKVGAVDNTLTDGTRSNKAIHEVAVTADDRYAGIERQVLVIARDNDYRDCQRLEQIVKQGFTLDGKTVIDQVTACLPEGTTMDLAIRHLNGTRFEWTIEGVDDDTKTTTSRASINVETPGTYSVVVTDRFGCVATSDEIVMNVQPAPKEPVFLVNENPDMLRPVAGKMYDYIVEAQDATFSWTFPTDWIVAPNTPDINGNIIPLIAGKEMGNVCVTVSDKTGLCPATNACLGVSSLQTGTANVSVYPTSLPADHNELWITPSGFDIDDVMVINKLGMQQSFTIQSTEGSLPIRNGVQAKIVVQNLSAGHYFLIFKGSNGETVSKIVVKE